MRSHPTLHQHAARLLAACAAQHPEWIWIDVESYKTGFAASDYADDLSPDKRQHRNWVDKDEVETVAEGFKSR